MDFVTLYGTELDRELGSEDRSQLFTTARRKAAINQGQLEWVKQTECLQKETSVALSDDTQDYDLEASISDFGWIARQGVSIQIVTGSTTRYIEGDDLIVTSVERLNVEQPGWRAVSKGTPTHVYTKRDGGAVKLGFYPKPSISGSETWSALLPYVLVPADLSADGDEPFTVGGNPLRSLRPWHRALVHFAAFDLEKFRKDTARGAAQFQLFGLEVQRFTGVEKPKGGQTVRYVKDYRRRPTLVTRSWLRNPRVN